MTSADVGLVCVPGGWLATNCYLLWDKESLAAAVIDPGAEGRKIVAEIKKLGLRVSAILNTHGHGDHIHANGAVKSATAAPICIHEKDGPMLTNPMKNLSLGLGFSLHSPAADRFLKAGDTLAVGRLALTVLETPGHTEGSICLRLADQLLFSGDTLFARSAGRTDLPGGSPASLRKSLRMLAKLPRDMKVYPGHGPATTIGLELRQNPFFLEFA